MFSEPGVGNLVVLTIHRVISDTGLVLVSPDSNQKVDKPSLPDDWSSSSLVILRYSLPQLLSADYDSDSHDIVLVMFKTFGSGLLEVNGALLKGNSISNLYKVYVCGHSFDELLVFSCSGAETDSKVESLKSFSDRSTSYSCKIVSDNLALPLLIDLCYSTGLPLPPCLMSLPPDLKLKILELLPSTDVAKTACVSSEMRIVASDDYLWEKKVEEEFGVVMKVKMTWKETFGWYWKRLYWPFFCIEEFDRETFSPVYVSSYWPYRGRGPHAAAAVAAVAAAVDDDNGGIWL